ncbi:alkylation response protein AidB-like acyl-CoA dehydrogenase [Lewinella marina]|uniref:Acyl-CoA dehydrogenase n=1 Tax=Neolewinella marina TaxID=438751 RepID=A0A2G0CGN8_9BACT|nr:acyl-CoA dehydrogenase family protein [Neolewinella marina]NJB86393.1 alkylation response protein AidB-like acyl-CoA dehydrogenase [Neolewinella marina]PHK99139.1 acyl-CoA dehydrogenase [Neolewinella marina]
MSVPISNQRPPFDTARWDELRQRFAAWAPSTFADGGFPTREMDALRTEGLLGVTLPGAPLDQRHGHTPAQLRLLKEVGQANLSVGRIYEGHVNALQLIGIYGTETQRTRWFADARAGHLFGVWNTQMADGISFHPDPDGRVKVTGSKSFCSGSVRVTRPLITGNLQGGWQMAVVPLDDHPVRVDESFWNPAGMRNSVSYKIDFTGITLEAADLLGGPNDYNRQPYFSGGAIRFAAVQLGGGAALLEATRDYLREVGRTEDPYQRTRVGQMAIYLESGHLWLERAGQLADQGGDPAHIVHYANMTRTAIAGYCEACLELAQRCVGARGLLHPHPLARLQADLTMYLRQPAPDAVLEAVGQYHLNDPAAH